MPADIVWSRLARDELLDIYVTIGLEDTAAAERFYDRVETRVRHLANHPRMGPRRPDIRVSVRLLVEAPYLILYETYPDQDDGPVSRVEIVNVVHARRNLFE